MLEGAWLGEDEADDDAGAFPVVALALTLGKRSVQGSISLMTVWWVTRAARVDHSLSRP